MNYLRIISSRALVVVAVVIATVTGTVYERRVAANQREQLQALQNRSAPWERQIAALRRERDETLNELKVAEHQLAALSPVAGVFQNGAERAREIETKAWLARVRQLKRLFAEDRARQIPEMQFLTDDDWLRVAKRVDLSSDTGVREALAMVRNVAKSLLARNFERALMRMKLERTTGSQFLLTTTEIAPYFDPPVDRAIFQRYAVVRTGTAASSWVIQERAPIDEDYDSRYQVASNGATSSRNPPTAWIEHYETLAQRAYKAYTDANNGASPSKPSQLIPYFNPPLAPATVEKLIKAEREVQR